MAEFNAGLGFLKDIAIRFAFTVKIKLSITPLDL